MSRKSSKAYRDGYIQIILDLIDGPKTASVLAESSGMTLNTVCDFLDLLEEAKPQLVYPTTCRPKGSEGRRVTLWHWCPVPGQIPDTAKP